MAQGIFYSTPALSLMWLESSAIFWSLSCASTNICWRKINERPAVWRINNTNFIMSVFSSTNILFIHRTILFYWKFWCSAGLSLYRESSPNGMMPICVSYGLSPTCRRHTVFPVFWPLISGLLSILGLPEESACCITASKAGWTTAWWRMLNTYVLGPCIGFCVCLLPSQPIITVTINLAWDMPRKVHRGIWTHSCSSTVLRGHWLTNKKHFSPQVACSSLSVTLGGEVAENQLSCQKGQRSFLWVMWLLYLFILLI